jgi:hypothetical protein
VGWATKYQSDPDVWWFFNRMFRTWRIIPQLVRQWLITQAVTEQTLSLTIFFSYLFSYFYMVVSNYWGYLGTPKSSNPCCFRIHGSTIQYYGRSTCRTMWSTPQGRSMDQLEGFVATFFPCETWGADVFKRAFFWAMFFFRDLWNTRSGKKRELCWSSGHQIEVSRSAKIALHLPQGSSLGKRSPEFTYLDGPWD